MKIGVLGGTFDPVHNGHLAVAEAVHKSLHLDKFLMLPAGQPWLKSGRRISPAPNRLAMLRLAIAGKSYLEISQAEIEREGPSYTVDTIAAMRQTLDESDVVYFIMGWDSLGTLPLWKDIRRLIQLCILVAVPRPGATPQDLMVLEASVPGIKSRLVILNEPRIEISATEIRQRACHGLSLSGLTPPQVENYIKEHNLYKGEDEQKCTGPLAL
jgi:nicotinate-nucleotide adenylyltransferase